MEFNEFFEELSNALEKSFNGFGDAEEKSNSDDNFSSYYHYTNDKYDNGKKVSHVEKEIKNGEVIKDVSYSIDTEAKKKPISNVSKKYKEDIKDNGKEVTATIPSDSKENLSRYSYEDLKHAYVYYTERCEVAEKEIEELKTELGRAKEKYEYLEKQYNDVVTKLNNIRKITVSANS